jgi:lysophospholipase L1-like esterase
MPIISKFRCFIIIATLFLVSFSGCNSKIETKETSKSEHIRYLALGDSYTIGTGIEEEINYPNQLSDSLSAKGFGFDTTQIIAVNGWTTTDLKEGIEAASPDSAFDMVSLLIGVNNQYQGLELDLYRTEFRELLEQAIAFAGSDTSAVWILSIPNYGITPFAESRNLIIIGQEIEVYNSIAKEIASEYDIPFIDITPISELAADENSLLASDELHPSAMMYAMWVEVMMPTVTQILNAND